jgi:hypothetical protein
MTLESFSFFFFCQGLCGAAVGAHVALGAGSVAALTTVVSVSFGGYGAGLVGQKVRFAAFIIMRIKGYDNVIFYPDTMSFFILIPRWYCDLF